MVGCTFRRKWQSASRPVLLLCDDGKEYVVKGSHAGRQIVNDHIVAHLGAALGAPVSAAALVIIPDELKQAEREMADVSAGLSHGSLWIPGCSERDDRVACSEVGNPERFALLAVLFGWCFGNDQQFIYSNQAPRIVYSVDHGHFFPNGPDWKMENLASAAPPRPDARIVGQCPSATTAMGAVIAKLKEISNDAILNAVSSPPDEWGLAMDERVALAQYLLERRDSFTL
jgi:HipA-like kinase